MTQVETVKPEGSRGFVMMTVELFEQLVRENGLTVTDWGTADRLSVRGHINDIYVPTVSGTPRRASSDPRSGPAHKHPEEDPTPAQAPEQGG